MAFDFSGRHAVVCGGSRGIGRAIALGLAQAGAAVSICARGAETLEATRAEIAQFGADVTTQGGLMVRTAATSPMPRAHWAASTSW